MKLTYASYLKLDELLALQVPRSEGPEHDETLFIVIHQVYELWFKQMLHELSALGPALQRADRPVVMRCFKRMLTILKIAVAQVDVLETMSPLSFASFRDRLESSSGFQSFQFRELEFKLGHRSRQRLAQMPEESRVRLEPLLSEPTLWDHHLKYLAKDGYAVPRDALERDTANPIEASSGVQRMLIEVYRKGDLAVDVCERLMDLDEGLQEWRYRHVKMVERQIGTKAGTGGTPSGADYLRQTLFKPLYPDLWAIRSQL